MAKTRPPYSPEFRRRMVELVRAGRDPDDLAREFEPTAQSIGHWVAVADRRDGRREEKVEVVFPTERDELIRLRRENKQLRQERDILSRAAAWFARETGAVPSGCSGSSARTRPGSPSASWRACSACRRPASMPGAAGRLRPARARLPRC